MVAHVCSLCVFSPFKDPTIQWRAEFEELICDKTDKIGSVYMWSVLQVEGGDVGPNMGSAATPPSSWAVHTLGRRRAAALRRGYQ